MQQGVRSSSDLVSPLLRLVKQREQLFFEVVSFVSRNIECSSNDLDSTSVFNRFLPSLRSAHEALSTRERQLLGQVAEEGAAGGASKDIMRLSSRIIELLEASVARVRKGIFDEGGRASKDFSRFKLALHKLLKSQPFPLSEYCENVISFTNAKFVRQLSKLQKYLDRVSQGEEIFLRQVYQQLGSDYQASPEEDNKPAPPPPPSLKKQSLRLNLEARGEEERKPRRMLKSSVKKREKVQSTRHKGKEEVAKEGRESSEDEGTARVRPSKEQTANKLLKFYALLQLNKKEFLQDYVFQEAEEQRQRAELMSKLLERNRVINSQINNYVKKSACFLPVPLIIMPPPNSRSSGEERSDSSPHVPSKTSFLITKRRGSFHIEPDHPELPPTLDRSLARPSNTSRRRSSQSSQRAPVQKSRKLFVVKQPMVFEDEIPQAEVTHTHWLQAPMSLKKDRKNNDNIRLKRKHNPGPLQNAHLPDSFRYPL